MTSSIKTDRDKLFLSAHIPTLDQSTLTIHNSLNGKKILANSYRFNSLDLLKEYISTCFNIPVNMLFILTPFGIKLKFSMVLHDQIDELYVFDRNFFNLNDYKPDRDSQLSPFIAMKPVESPLLSYGDFKDDNIRGCINALKRNSGWAAAILSDFKKAKEYQLHNDEDDCIQVMLKSLNVLIQYLSLSSQTLQKNLDSSFEYFTKLNDHSLITEWESYYQTLKKIKFKLSNREINLANSIPKTELVKISKEAALKTSETNHILQMLSDKVKIEIKLEKLKLENDYNLLKQKYLTSTTTSDDVENIGNSQILKLQLLVEQIVEDVNDLPNNSPDVVAEIFRKHQLELVPEISQISNDIYKKHLNLNKNKISLQEHICQFIFKKIAKIQISLMNLQKTITNELHPRLTLLQNLEIKLSIVIDLPLIFGILIISKYKNYRWFQNFKKICYRTNEILEMLKFLELNSRSKWAGKILGNDNDNHADGKGFLSQYQDFLGILKEEDFVGEHMANLQLIFEATQDNKIVIDTSVTTTKNKALNKFITSLNNNLTSNGSDEQYNLWSELKVTNIKDIYNYIEILRKNWSNGDIVKKLERNLADCGLNDDGSFNIKDENFMNFYKNFLKNYEIDGFIIEFGNNNTNDIKDDNNDKDIIKGYENRIKKLENLLHQQQFLQFNQQFQTRFLQPLNSDTLNENRQQISLPRNRNFNSNDNFVDDEIDEYKRQINDLNDQNEEQKRQICDLNDENKILKSQIESLKRELSDNNDHSTSHDELEKVKLELGNANETISKLNGEIERLNQNFVQEKLVMEQNYKEVNSMKNDLIENMSSLRKDHEEESSLHLKQIEELKFKSEELEQINEEYQCLNSKLTEVMHDKNQVIERLSNVINSMYLKLKELSQLLFVDLSMICMILESIGLLLVEEEDNEERKIIRVKGLKKNKSVKQQITSDIITELEKSLYWTDLSIENETTSVKDMLRDSSSPLIDDDDEEEEEDENSISELDIHSKALIHKFDNEIFDKNYQTFVKSLKLSDDILINSVTKRFKDVESLARKFQKDLNLQNLEIDKLTQLLQTKISIRDFKQDDLVLFLPTTEEFNEGNMISKQWAAFNIGAPHFFLKNVDNNNNTIINLSNRDWLVARISSLKEFQITEENFNDELLNPFKLSVGICWYYVDAKEENL